MGWSQIAKSPGFKFTDIGNKKYDALGSFAVNRRPIASSEGGKGSISAQIKKEEPSKQMKGKRPSLLWGASTGKSWKLGG